MARSSRSNDWGFPRWRAYGAEREAQTVKLCDRYGCGHAGTHPAPKAPNKPDRWLFCQAHAAEYNRNWDYFQGLTPEEAAAEILKGLKRGKSIIPVGRVARLSWIINRVSPGLFEWLMQRKIGAGPAKEQ